MLGEVNITFKIVGKTRIKGLGESYILDPNPQTFKCSYDCVYCPLKTLTPKTLNLKLEQISNSILIISGRGDPLLKLDVKNIRNVIQNLHKLRSKVGIHIKNIIPPEEIATHIDFIILKLDTLFEEVEEKVNRPRRKLLREKIKFIKNFKKKVIVEISLTKYNKDTLSLRKLLYFISNVKPLGCILTYIDHRFQPLCSSIARILEDLMPNSIIDVKSYVEI